MPAMSTRTIDSQWKETQFETTPIMSTYLVAIVVSDLKPRNFTFDSDYKKYELRMWAREDAYSQTEHALDFGIKTYKYFTEYFATPDVVPKADHVAVPDFLAGAMENWGLVIYRETSLLYDKQVSSSHDKFTVTLIVAHEIAHTWFGNMVTMEWWDDLWLNEGFASLLMYLAMDHVYPTWNVFALQVVDLLSTMVKDALTTSHPVSSHIIDPDEIPQHFDSISYSKGMAILRMITGFAGADNFRDGIRRYVQKYKFKNARMSQLWDTLTESFNNTFDVARIMESWTCQMGYPLVTIEEGDGHFILHQTRFLLDQDIKKEHETNASAEYKWNIPFTYVTQRQSHKPKTVWLNFTSATIHEPNDKWILGNYEFIGYYKVMYSSQMWSLLAKQLLEDHTVFPEANRAVLIGDAFAFARANVLDYNVALNLTRYLSKEQSSIPWESFLHSIEFLKGMISYNAAYTQLQQYLKKLVAPVFEMVGTADKGELPEKYLRRVILSLACDVGVDKAVEYAKSMFANWMKHDARLPPDLSMVIYSVGIREGDSTEWDYVWNKKLSTTVASEENIMMESLVYTQKPSLLWRYIKWLLDPSKIKPQDVRVVIGYFSKTPLSRMVAVQFVMSQWDDLIAKFSNDQFILRDIIQEVTAFVNTEFNLEQFERIFAKNTPKVASKSVENALALIRANIGWMKTNYEKITTWLEHEKY
nr:glutamyl aminopeptidase-like [Biomphalaria glabrata]